MTRRALLIASQTFGLRGCHFDLLQMERALEKFGFQSSILSEGMATREGILKAFSQLHDQTGAGDCALLYYSGHGGILEVTDPQPGDPHQCQFLVPVDFDTSSNGQFKGILDLELSQFQAALAARTDNIVQIFDCCYSGGMARSHLRHRSIPSYPRPLHDLLGQLRNGTSADSRPVESNPFSVRLTASGRFEQAHEYENVQNQHIGVFTEALTTILGQAVEVEIDWQSIMNRVREWVLATYPGQRPGLEGPGHRLLFETETRLPAGPAFFYDIRASDPIATEATPYGLPSLRAGRLMGVCEGDVYGLDDLRTPNRHRATVTQVLAGVARLRLETMDFISASSAVLLEKEQAVCLVRLEAELPELAKAIRASPLVDLWREGDRPPLARVRLSGNLIEVANPADQLLAWPTASVQVALRTLENWARALSLSLLEDGTGPFALKQPFSLDWGRVINNGPCSWQQDPRPLKSGDRIYVDVTNEGTRMVWVTILNIGISGKICVLTRSQLSTGIPLRAGANYQLGRRVYDGLIGLPISWPESVPRRDTGREKMILILTDSPQDFSMLETGIIPDRSSSSHLQQLMLGMHLGKKTRMATDASVRYAVRHFAFELSGADGQ